VLCGSLNCLRSLLLGFQKLRNQWSSGSNFFWNFFRISEPLFSCLRIKRTHGSWFSKNSKELMVLVNEQPKNQRFRVGSLSF
jgi:hypothetical protein